jgi:hypothetical protein
LEKDLVTLAMLVSLWDEGGGPPWQAILTKSIKSKAISLHSFPMFLLFIYLFFENFDFMTCNDGKQKHDVEKE